MVFLKKLLFPDYRGLSVVSKKVFSAFLAFFSITALGMFLVFCTSVEGHKVHHLSQIGFLNNVLTGI